VEFNIPDIFALNKLKYIYGKLCEQMFQIGYYDKVMLKQILHVMEI